MEYSKSDKIKYLKTQLGNVASDVKAIKTDRVSTKENLETEYNKKRTLRLFYVTLLPR